MVDTIGARLGAAIWHLRARLDDFGPVDQEPDDAFQRACELAGSCSRSTPTQPPPPDVPNGGSGSGSGGGAGFVGALMWLFIAAAVAALGFAVYRAIVARTPRPDDGDGQDDESADIAVPARERVIDRSREPDTWRLQAAQFAAEGRFREAMRCRYRGLVGDLARRGMLDEIPGRTTGEERRQLAEIESPAQMAFDEATFLFDDVWYGDRAIGEVEYAAFVDLEESVLADAGRLVRSGRGSR